MDKPKKKKVGNFVIDFHKQLGKGQFGTVYQATNMDSNELVAVKIIIKADIYDDEYTKNALVRQIQIMKNLKSTNIIQFVEIQQTTNNIYIFQELANGGTLADLLKKSKRFQQKKALQYISQILNGFKQLIAHGIIHRDIKLTNILLKDNVCKIADFGMSKYSGALSLMTSVVGTPIYMAPQIMQYQSQNCRYTYKCDIWSFGVVCYELVTGTIPWKNIAGCQLKDLLVKIKQQCKIGIQFPADVKISQSLKDLIRGCLKYEEQDRYDWDKVLKHKVFQGQFKDANSGYENFTLTQLRMKVHCNNVNLQKFISKMPEMFTKQDFFNLLKTLHEQITEKQAFNLFKFFAKQKNQVSKKAILDGLQNHGIKLRGIVYKEPQRENIYLLIQKISKHIEANNINLFDLFKKHDKKKNNTLGLQQFSGLLKSIFPQINKNQVDQLFSFFNPDAKKGIKFERFYEKICKAVQVPAVRNENVSKQIKKMEQRNKS